jgi:hypothetical protein
VTLELPNGARPSEIFISTAAQYCNFCRATTHRRAQCPSAPACRHCGLSSHGPLKCPSLHRLTAPVPQKRARTAARPRPDVPDTQVSRVSSRPVAIPQPTAESAPHASGSETAALVARAAMPVAPPTAPALPPATEAAALTVAPAEPVSPLSSAPPILSPSGPVTRSRSSATAPAGPESAEDPTCPPFDPDGMDEDDAVAHHLLPSPRPASPLAGSMTPLASAPSLGERAATTSGSRAMATLPSSRQ